jgi:hypothetical protein
VAVHDVAMHLNVKLAIILARSFTAQTAVIAVNSLFPKHYINVIFISSSFIGILFKAV